MNETINLNCQNLTKSFGKNNVLNGCTLKIQTGEFIGIVGENGSGKSTFIRCILGFLKPDAGSMQINSHLGYCPQDNVLNSRYKVKEHLSLVESIITKHWNVDHEFLDSCLKRLKLLPFLNSLIGNLSGGTYQKVKFLTSIFHLPKLLILDEPYDGFDWQMYLVFWDIIAELKFRGTSILMISHLIYDRDKFDKIFRMNEGYLEQTQ